MIFQEESILTWASFQQRTLGFFIDVILMMAALILIMFLFGLFGVHLPWLPALLPAVMLFRDVPTNRSIGKRIMRLQIVKKLDGEVPSKGALVLRNLLFVFGPIELLCLAVQKEGRRFGDLSAATIVLGYSDRPRPLRNTKKRLLFTGGGILVFFVITFGGAELLLQKSGAYEMVKEAAKTDTQVRERVGEVTGFGLFPQGSIELANGEGTATYRIKVKGKNGNVYVYSSLHKDTGESWKLDFLRIAE